MVAVYKRRRDRKPGIPEGAVYVGRPSKWANPYRVSEHGLAESLQRFVVYAIGRMREERDWLEPLRGRSLACWCRNPGDPPEKACHGQLLLILANAGLCWRCHGSGEIDPGSVKHERRVRCGVCKGTGRELDWPALMAVMNLGFEPWRGARCYEARA